MHLNPGVGLKVLENPAIIPIVLWEGRFPLAVSLLRELLSELLGKQNSSNTQTQHQHLCTLNTWHSHLKPRRDQKPYKVLILQDKMLCIFPLHLLQQVKFPFVYFVATDTLSQWTCASSLCLICLELVNGKIYIFPLIWQMTNSENQRRQKVTTLPKFGTKYLSK